MTDTVCEENRY